MSIKDVLIPTYGVDKRKKKITNKKRPYLDILSSKSIVTRSKEKLEIDDVEEN